MPSSRSLGPTLLASLSQFVRVESKIARAAGMSPFPNAAGRNLKPFVKVGAFAAVAWEKMAEMAKNRRENTAYGETAKRGKARDCRIVSPGGSRPAPIRRERGPGG
jgi:hypothetical protein